MSTFSATFQKIAFDLADFEIRMMAGPVTRVNYSIDHSINYSINGQAEGQSLFFFFPGLLEDTRFSSWLAHGAGSSVEYLHSSVRCVVLF